MYDVIYFDAWSDIICTAAKLLHGTSAFRLKSCFVFCLSHTVIKQVRFTWVDAKRQENVDFPAILMRLVDTIWLEIT